MLKLIAGTVIICILFSPVIGHGGEVWELGNLKSVCLSVEVPANTQFDPGRLKTGSRHL